MGYKTEITRRLSNSQGGLIMIIRIIDHPELPGMLKIDEKTVPDFDEKYNQSGCVNMFGSVIGAIEWIKRHLDLPIKIQIEILVEKLNVEDMRIIDYHKRATRDMIMGNK